MHVIFIFFCSSDEDDFDGTVLTIMFPADEDEPSPITSLPVPIAIADDVINEAEVQFFLTYMEVINTTNRALLDSQQQNFSRCVIADNDCK